MTEPSANRVDERAWLRPYTKLLVLATLCLIFLGGQVKSHEAGLAVPDWPTTYGQNMFLFPLHDWVGNIFHEHLHRVVAASVGMLCIGLAIWMGIRERRPWARWLGCAALGLVIVQGLFGGLTVRLLLPAWVSSTHAVLAQTFFLLVIFIAYTQSRERRRREDEAGDAGSWPMARPALIVTGLVYVQLILGALMRHTESGLAIPDFPKMAGRWIPWFTQDSVAWVNQWRLDYGFETGKFLDDVTLAQLWIHFAHRMGALLIVVGLGYAAWRAFTVRRTAPRVWQSMLVLIALVVCQIALGITTVLTHKAPVIASLHVATGAATLGWSWLLALRAMPLHVRVEDAEVAEVPARAAVREVKA